MNIIEVIYKSQATNKTQPMFKNNNKKYESKVFKIPTT